MTEIRRFLVFLLVAGGLLGVAATVSYVADPGVYDGDAYEAGVATILLSGQNVGNIKNYDERLLQKILIERDQRRIDTIVLGSSRSMQIHESTYTSGIGADQDFLNHAVSKATLEDYIATLELYSKKGDLPGTVIIGVDPWILNVNNSQTDWKTLEPEYQQGLARIGASPVPSEEGFGEIVPDLDRYASLVSSRVIMRSVGQLLSNRTSYYPTDLEELDVSVKSKDGSFRLSTRQSNLTTSEIDAEARAYAYEGPIFALDRFTRIDERSREHFESTIRYLQSRNVRVILFLPPYHPIVYDALAADLQYANVMETESYYKEFAAKENITVVGSYNPSRFNLSSSHFVDGAHPRREAIDELFSRATSASPKGISD